MWEEAFPGKTLILATRDRLFLEEDEERTGFIFEGYRILVKRSA